LVLDGASARVENNRILGGLCANAPPVIYGLRIFLGALTGEPDVHSNDIDPAGSGTTCSSYGVAIDPASGDIPSAGALRQAGIFRNNVILAGTCPSRLAMVENASVAARLVENNDLYVLPGSADISAPVLYRRGATDAVSADQVNALGGMTKNISADPSFITFAGDADLHLTATSPCIDQGTSLGAPTSDADGRSRPQGAGFDIGAYEYVGP
jgi:hypothetical protein